MKPMLAKHYKKSKVNFPCYIQPKLDGVRALWLGNKLQSRSYGREEELVWHEEVLPEIHEALKQFPQTYFDGELYVHGWSRQKINSVARVKSVNPHKEHKHLQYHIFDLISDEPFFNRWEKLESLKDKLRHPLVLVETIFCHSEIFGDTCYKDYRSQGFEGAIYRDLRAHYGFDFNCSNQENRWSCLLKRKTRQDMECECVGVEMSDKFEAIKAPHIRALQLRTPEGQTFSCSGGLSHEEKIRFVDEPPLGCVVHVSYDILSDIGKPIQPSIEVVYV